MTPEYVLRKSLCRAPHCAGPYELRDTPFKDWPQTARKGVIRSAETELSCMDFASEYAETGYQENPPKGILFANWNYFPPKVCDLLEKYGYAIEWSDEWIRCDGCNKALRTSPDCYSWQPSFVESEDGCFCVDCLSDDCFDLYLDNPARAVNIRGLDLKAYGFKEIQCGFESGWFPGQNDNPHAIHKELSSRGFRKIVFQVSEQSQFYIGFCVWYRPCEGCNDKGWRYATRDDGRRAIECCDNCERYGNDEAAADAATAAGFVCETTYPCYVISAPKCECGADYDDSCIPNH